MVASAYSPYDLQEPPPPVRVAELIAHCREKGLPLRMGCDDYSHHTVWGSSNVKGSIASVHGTNGSKDP